MEQEDRFRKLEAEIADLQWLVADLREDLAVGKQAFVLVTNESLVMKDVLRINIERNARRLGWLTRAHNRAVFKLTPSPSDCAPGWARRTAQAKSTWAKRRAM